jgi:hypothetical protein
MGISFLIYAHFSGMTVGHKVRVSLLIVPQAHIFVYVRYYVSQR